MGKANVNKITQEPRSGAWFIWTGAKRAIEFASIRELKAWARDDGVGSEDVALRAIVLDMLKNIVADTDLLTQKKIVVDQDKAIADAIAAAKAVP